MNNLVTFLAIGIAILSILMSVVVISLNHAESSKITSLQQELDQLKAQMATPSGRGTVTQQSISKMTNLGSMNNDDPNMPDTTTRLENVEKQVSQLKSQIESLKP